MVIVAYDLSPLSEYDLQAWNQIQSWKVKVTTRKSIAPERVKQRLQQLGESTAHRWLTVPGSSQINLVTRKVLSGGTQILADAASASLQRDRILSAARSAGAGVESLGDIRHLDLQTIDLFLPGLNLRYAATSAATGAISGFVAGGGTAAIVGTAGVAAAPGALAVAGTLAADVIATVALATRVVTHYAGYYGYDTRNDLEQAYLLAIIGLATAGEASATQAALLNVRKVAMMVARRTAWKELNEEAIVKVIQKLFTSVSARLTQEKLAQALPVVGVVAGGSLNYSLMRRVGTAASHMYRERFLIDKYQLDAGELTTPLPELVEFTDLEVLDSSEDDDDGNSDK